MDLVSVADYEQRAKEILSKTYFVFFRGGAGAELTLEWNKKAFEKIRFRPRILRNVSLRSMTCNILGTELDMPFGIAPTASHQFLNSDGELATARAADALNTLYIMSSSSNKSIEEVTLAAPNLVKWMQTYVFGNKQLTENVIRKAEKCGFKAIVVTVDMPVYGIRREEAKVNFFVPEHVKMPNFEGINVHVKPDGGSVAEEVINSIMNPSFTWDDVRSLVRSTKLPVILKGILTSDDALLAVEAGCKGIIVSNHGGRQLDGAPATIEALPEVVEAVGNQIPVMMDGGIQDGANIYKALALGAKFVFVGRPVLWGLAVKGQKGVENVLNILKRELDVTMALCGTPTIDKISKEYVAYRN